jgi:hypothetical protein
MNAVERSQSQGRWGFSIRMVVGICTLITLAGVASADSVGDGKTRDLLIQKLTLVYLNLAPGDAAKTAITMRLADLHAERARVDAMAELSAGCVTCTAGNDDRGKALKLYQEALPKVPDAVMGQVLAQVGHLYELTGNDKDAIATYERIIKDQKKPQENSQSLAEAHLSYGELLFKRRNYPEAQKHFQAVLDLGTVGNRSLSAYRVAWCEFNQSHLDPAIEGLTKMLRTPELITRSSQPGAPIDHQFQDEVSRDLATFLARRSVTVKDAELVYQLSPESTRLANTVYLAGEVERLGQVAPAIEIWRFVLERQPKPQGRLESLVRLAQLEMEQKATEAALKDYQAALDLWVQVVPPGTAPEGEAKELKTRLRKFVLDWNRVEQKTPSSQLFSAYQGYLKVFTTEGDMFGWAAKVASDLKQYALAVELSGKAAAVSSQEKAATDVTARKTASAPLEAALLQAIESAELSKDAKLLDMAYDSYLKLSQSRAKALEVSYQKAHLVYDRGDYKQAADELKAVAYFNDRQPAAISAPKNAETALRKQAADLALDSLVLLKDDADLELWASEFSQYFSKAMPDASTEFASVARKSVLTQAAHAATDVNTVSLETAWTTLSRFDISAASSEERATYFKNRLILAEKMGKFREAREASEELLRLPNLAVADREYALSRKAWLAELVLDFDSALKATEKLQASDLPMGQKWLKLAMYADLAMKDPRPFYGQFLKESKDEDRNVAIAAELVRSAQDPLKEIEKSKAVLLRKPEVMAALYVDIAAARSVGAKPTAVEIAKKVTAIPLLAQTLGGKQLARFVILNDYKILRDKLAAHKLDGSQQRKLAQTLKARVSLLDEADKLTGRAITSGDWTAQLAALDLLSKQNDRFYQELLSLPVPAGLSGEDEQQYLQLLSQQAAPHQVRAKDAAAKVQEFWQKSQAPLEALAENFAHLTGPKRAWALDEAKIISEIAADDVKTRITAMTEKTAPAKTEPNRQVLESARQAVRDNPLNRERLQALLELEKEMGRPAMVAYLEGRIEKLAPAAAPASVTGSPTSTN